jgi:hypothetical protein
LGPCFLAHVSFLTDLHHHHHRRRRSWSSSYGSPTVELYLFGSQRGRASARVKG